MITYDQYKLATPPEYDYPEKKCSYCGEPTDKRFCSTGCKIAEMND